eukprot:12829772-Alexandrium_andersonii.AAC.1
MQRAHRIAYRGAWKEHRGTESGTGKDGNAENSTKSRVGAADACVLPIKRAASGLRESQVSRAMTAL